jgi:hypothetical protein
MEKSQPAPRFLLDPTRATYGFTFAPEQHPACFTKEAIDALNSLSAQQLKELWLHWGKIYDEVVTHHDCARSKDDLAWLSTTSMTGAEQVSRKTEALRNTDAGAAIGMVIALSAYLRHRSPTLPPEKMRGEDIRSYEDLFNVLEPYLRPAELQERPAPQPGWFGRIFAKPSYRGA